MLELRDVSFRVSEDSKEKEKGILEHVSFTLEDNKFVAITGQTAAENPHWQNYCGNPEAHRRKNFPGWGRYYRLEHYRKSKDMVSAMHFSSRFALKG